MGREQRARQSRIIHDGLAKTLADSGRLVEFGFAIHAEHYLPTTISADERERCRECFMMGAQHYFAAILSFLAEGENITDADMRRMDLAANELDVFVRHFKKRHNVPDELYPVEKPDNVQ